MINFKFLKMQIKSSIWLTIGVTIILLLISILSMCFTPYFWDTSIGESRDIERYNGALNILGFTNIFGPVGGILALALAVVLATNLFSVDISRGYLASWLTLPMSRTTIFLTKILNIFFSILVIILSNLFIEFIIVAIKHYPDFTRTDAWILIKLNLGLFLTFILVCSIPVIFSVFFNKTSYFLSLSIIILVLFIVFFILGTFNEFFGLNGLKYLKYFTFFSLVNFNQLIDNTNNSFIWKFVLLLAFSTSLFVGSGFIFKTKDFHI